MKAFFVAILSFVIFVSCDPSISNENSTGDDKVVNLESVRFLEGTWKDKTTFGYTQPPKHMVETWKSYPDSLSGVAYYVKGGDTTLTEYVAIKMINNKLTYIAKPYGHSMISFTIIDNGENSFTFENKANEYPQRLIYEKGSKDTLNITLDGVASSIQRTITFKYCKEK